MTRNVPWNEKQNKPTNICSASYQTSNHIHMESTMKRKENKRKTMCVFHFNLTKCSIYKMRRSKKKKKEERLRKYHIICAMLERLNEDLWLVKESRRRKCNPLHDP